MMKDTVIGFIGIAMLWAALAQTRSCDLGSLKTAPSSGLKVSPSAPIERPRESGKCPKGRSGRLCLPDEPLTNPYR